MIGNRRAMWDAPGAGGLRMQTGHICLLKTPCARNSWVPSRAGRRGDRPIAVLASTPLPVLLAVVLLVLLSSPAVRLRWLPVPGLPASLPLSLALRALLLGSGRLLARELRCFLFSSNRRAITRERSLAATWTTFSFLPPGKPSAPANSLTASPPVHR